MYCMNCGAPMNGEDKFCTSCGAATQRDTAQELDAVRKPHDQAPIPAVPHPEGATVINHGARPINPIAVIALCIVALCVAGLAAAMALGVIGPHGDSGENADSVQPGQASPAGQSTVSTANTSSNSQEASAGAQDVAKDASPDNVSEPAASANSAKTTDWAAQPGERTLSSPINLANKNDYYDLNIFLSNFAEWPEFYWRAKSFDRDRYDKEHLVNWGMWHNALNNKGTLERGQYDLEDAPAASWSKEIGDRTPKSQYSRRMKTDLIEKSIARYIGLSINLKGYDSGNGDYYERDGYVYEGTYRGSASPVGNVVLSQSVEAIGTNKVRVKFKLFESSAAVSEALTTKDWYGMTDSELAAAMKKATGNEPRIKYGTAVVDVAGSGDPRFKLAAFSVAE